MEPLPMKVYVCCFIAIVTRQLRRNARLWKNGKAIKGYIQYLHMYTLGTTDIIYIGIFLM